MKIDLDSLSEFGAPSWLETMEIRRQTGLSATQVGAQLTRVEGLGADYDFTDDVDLMEAIGVVLWVVQWRLTPDLAYSDFIAGLQVTDLVTSASPPAAPNRATRRAKAPAAKAPAVKKPARRV